jgi:hypothetical protein
MFKAPVKFACGGEWGMKVIEDPNQFGGVRQNSTEDAGCFLLHVVRAGWQAGLKTLGESAYLIIEYTVIILCTYHQENL